MKKLSILAVAALVTISAVSNSYAWVGAGLHWGYDISMNMDDKLRENVDFGLTLDVPLLGDVGDQMMYVSRMNWKNSPLNFGGKVYVDVIPFINTLELSCNFGLWQYDGALHVLDLEATAGKVSLDNPTLSPADFVYKEIPMTLKNSDLSYVGLSGTPYAKLHFDASARKTVFDLAGFLKIGAGAGVSAHFATPLLSNTLVEKALDIELDETALISLADPTNPLAKQAAKKIVQEIIDEALGKPVIGGHIILGVSSKLPVIPVGVYVDGKYMFPFSKFDKDASGVKGFGSGLLLNMGISLSI